MIWELLEFLLEPRAFAIRRERDGSWTVRRLIDIGDNDVVVEVRPRGESPALEASE